MGSGVLKLRLHARFYEKNSPKIMNPSSILFLIYKHHASGSLRVLKTQNTIEGV